MWQVRSAIAPSLSRIRIIIFCEKIIEVSHAMLMIVVLIAMAGLMNFGKG